MMNVNVFVYSKQELLPSGWQLKSKLFMAFFLFQATKELESDKLGTGQHRFALCKGIMKSLNPSNCFC